MVVVREQERVARCRMRSIYIHGNRHVMRRAQPLEMLMAREQTSEHLAFFPPFVAF